MAKNNGNNKKWHTCRYLPVVLQDQSAFCIQLFFSFQVKIKYIIFEVSPPRYYSLSTPSVSHGFTPPSLPKSPPWFHQVRVTRDIDRSPGIASQDSSQITASSAICFEFSWLVHLRIPLQKSGFHFRPCYLKPNGSWAPNVAWFFGGYLGGGIRVGWPDSLHPSPFVNWDIQQIFRYSTYQHGNYDVI